MQQNYIAMIRFVLFIITVLLLASCRDKQRLEAIPVDKNGLKTQELTQKVHPGKQIMEQECYICHDPKASMTDRIAPPMEAIKRHYIDSGNTKEAFTRDLIRWVNDPTTETRIPGAHTRFGPMPYMPLPDDAIAQIADYIYDHELERPHWFDDHFNKAHQNGSGMRQCSCFDYPEPEDQYAAIGTAYAKEAQRILGKNLEQAIMEGGAVNAISYCHSQAIKLTDSISLMRNAVMKRITDRPRNPDNMANNIEMQHLSTFKALLASGLEMKPMVQLSQAEATVYLPITTNALCLQCHGTPGEQISPETLTILQSLYPQDSAMGYGLNEIRGIWSINIDTEFR